MLRYPGSGWSQPTFNVMANKTKTVFVKKVQGESGLAISFVAQGQTKQKEDLAYIETHGGYCVVITVNEELNIEATYQGRCFSLRRAV